MEYFLAWEDEDPAKWMREDGTTTLTTSTFGALISY